MTSELLGVRPPAVIPAELSRSWLLVGAHRPDLAKVVAESNADQVIVDLEDSVPRNLRRRALDQASAILTHAPVWLRVNSRTSGLWEGDLSIIAGTAAKGVMLAKAESPEAVEETHRAVTLPVIPLVESALGIEESLAIARSSGVLRLAFGVGDYRRDTVSAGSDLALVYPRTRLVVASRAAGLASPIDGPAPAGDAEEVTRSVKVARELGLGAKLCLREEHVATLNREFAPSPEERAWAEQMLAADESADPDGRDGSYLPLIARARKIVELARAYG